MTQEKAALRKILAEKRAEAFATVPDAGVRLLGHFPEDIYELFLFLLEAILSPALLSPLF